MGKIISYTLLTVVAFAVFIGGGYFVWNRQAIVEGRNASYASLYPMGVTASSPDAWTSGYLSAEPTSKVVWVRELLGGAVGAAPTTLERIELLVGYMLSEVQPYMGMNDIADERQTGLQVLDALLHGRSAVWGDSLTRAYVASANALGIPSRIVAVGDRELVASHPIHLFAESYICEHDTWAFVDVTSRKAYVCEANGRPLNAVELSEKLRAGSADHLIVALYQGGEVIHCPYGLHCNLEQDRLAAHEALCYPRAGHLYGSAAKRLSYDICFPKQTFSLQ